MPDGEESETKYNLDASRTARDLGLTPRNVEATLVDMAQSLIDHAIVKPSAGP